MGKDRKDLGREAVRNELRFLLRKYKESGRGREIIVSTSWGLGRPSLVILQGPS